MTLGAVLVDERFDVRVVTLGLGVAGRAIAPANRYQQWKNYGPDYAKNIY